MNEVRYTIPGDTRVRTAPESAVGTRAWKAQGCQLVPEMRPRPVAPIEPVQEPVPDPLASLATELEHRPDPGAPTLGEMLGAVEVITNAAEQEPAPAPEVTKRGPGRPKANANADQA